MEISRSSDGRTENIPTGYFKSALRFWEPRRIVYNLVLFLVFAVWVLLTWPHFRPAFHWFPLFQLSVLALLANFCYSAAYVADIVIQESNLGTAWRSALWIAGTVLAIIFENYWIADEIYDFVS